MAATGKGHYPHLDIRFRLSAPTRILTLTRAAGDAEKVVADYFWEVADGQTEVFFGNKINNIENGMKAQTAAEMGGVLCE